MLLFSFFFLLFFISLSVYLIFIHNQNNKSKTLKKNVKNSSQEHVYVKPTIKVVKNLSCHGLQASFQVSTSRSPFTVIKTGLLQERCGVQQGPGNPGGPGDSGRPILAGLNQSAIASTKGDVSGGAYERGSLSYQVGCLWLISKVLTFLLDTLWLSTYCYFSLVWPVYSFGLTQWSSSEAYFYDFSVLMLLEILRDWGETESPCGRLGSSTSMKLCIKKQK
ncbi:hypothetical protein EDC96DRAFT_549903 [Choanephora cucurbitarum]|nr:hypothetical protein EDC96DRAFT_549903 [Choanephora cucurbitarum]